MRIVAVVRQLARRRQVLQVRGALVMGIAQRGAVADDQRARPVRQEQPLVGIDGHAVGPLDPAEPLRPALGELEEPAVGRVDVQPQPFVGRDVGDRRRAGRSRRCSSSRRSEPPGTAACRPRGPAGSCRAGRRDPSGARRRSARSRRLLPAEAGDRRRLRHAGVRLFADVVRPVARSPRRAWRGER